MGSDSLFHRRKAKKASDLKRSGAKRKPMKKILIVCEGEKTEPKYFEDLINYYKLSATKIVEVTGDCGSNPKSVVEHAKKKNTEEMEKGTPYDIIYCVFDKDAHAHYQDSIVQINQLKPKGRFNVINSVPCFEYWLLLHYKFSRKEFDNSGKKTPGSKMEKELKKHLPDYEKKAVGLFEKLHDKLETAIKNSIKVREAAEKDGTDNPTTKVDILVQELTKVRNEFFGN